LYSSQNISSQDKDDVMGGACMGVGVNLKQILVRKSEGQRLVGSRGMKLQKHGVKM
jgi:hypothetical protein